MDELNIEEGLLFQYLIKIEDPRIERRKKHKLIDILLLSICCVICGCEGWNEIQEFAEENEEFFRKILDLPHGIPSHDTFRRVFCLLDPAALQKIFIQWAQSIHNQPKEDIIAIDGKTLRRSFEHAERNSAVHMIHAWSVGGNLILGQLKSEGKKNEIKTIPKLLELLNLKGATITIDAAGCQKEIAEKILEKEADYVLALKKNQPSLHERVEKCFKAYDLKKNESTKKISGVSLFETNEKGHGREDKRTYCCVSKSAWRRLMPSFQMTLGWKKLSTMIRVTSERRVKNKTSTEVRYFISSRKSDSKKLGKIIRSHWQIENTLHWSLDVNFNEDESRIRKMNSAENFGILRRFVFNMIKKDPAKKSLRMKRKRASWNPENMLKILMNPENSTI